MKKPIQRAKTPDADELVRPIACSNCGARFEDDGFNAHCPACRGRDIKPSEADIRAEIAQARNSLDYSIATLEKLAARLMTVDFDRGVVLANQVKALRTHAVAMKLEGA